MVGEQLQGNDRQNALQTVHRVGNGQRPVAVPLLLAVLRHVPLRLGVALLHDEDGVAAPGEHLLEGVDALRVDGVAHHHHDDGHRLVDQGQRAVLQLAGENALRVHVRQLLDLQGALCNTKEEKIIKKQKKQFL